MIVSNLASTGCLPLTWCVVDGVGCHGCWLHGGFDTLLLSYAIDPAAACCFCLYGCAYGERWKFRRIIVVVVAVEVRDLSGDWFDRAAMVVVVLVGYATVI